MLPDNRADCGGNCIRDRAIILPMNQPQSRLALCVVISMALHSALFFASRTVRVSLQTATGHAGVLLARIAPDVRSDALPAALVSGESPARDVIGPPPMPQGGAESTSEAVQGWQATPDRSLALPVIDDYLPPSRLTERPHPIDSIDPTPPGWAVTGVVGEVELLLLISSAGRVDAVLLVHATLPDAFVESAKLAFKTARFTPGMVNNHAVRSRLRIVVSPTALAAATESATPHSAKGVGGPKNR